MEAFTLVLTLLLILLTF